MRNIYTFTTLIVFALLFWASAEQKHLSTTKNTYAETKKAPKSTKLSYSLPVITPTSTTKQVLTKGGVTISAEIVTFTANREIKKERTIGYADPDKPGYDVYEVAEIPNYHVTPDAIQFKIRIKNTEQVPLKLSEIGFALVIDGIQFSFPSENLQEWNKGIVLTNFEKEINIMGPQLAGLISAQVVYIFLNGVPVDYDDAGTVRKKENFEWYFECRQENIEKEDIINYSYETEPIYRERCNACNGKGYFTEIVKCSTCNGNGVYKGYDGKIYKCYTCNGNGKVQKNYTCRNCGGKGENEYPKSQLPPIMRSITWSGLNVEVMTFPAGASVGVVDIETGEYYKAGMSNLKVDWYSSNEKSYPIIIEYQGKSVAVLPYDAKTGKEITQVIVDFRIGSPVIKKGTKAE